MIRTLPTARIAPYKLAHAVLRTAHLDATIRHYELLLNARMVFDQRPNGAALTYDARLPRLARLIDAPSGVAGAPESGRRVPGEEHHRLAFVTVPAPADDGAVEGIRVADPAGAVGLAQPKFRGRSAH
jgi:hypothetical protein